MESFNLPSEQLLHRAIVCYFEKQKKKLDACINEEKRPEMIDKVGRLELMADPQRREADLVNETQAKYAIEALYYLANKFIRMAEKQDEDAYSDLINDAAYLRSIAEAIQIRQMELVVRDK